MKRNGKRKFAVYYSLENQIENKPQWGKTVVEQR